MIKVTKLDLSKIKPTSRQENLERLKRWTEAQEELERVCKELGIPVPIMVC